MENMEAMSLCEEEVYVELCRMEEPPALEEMRAAVNMRGHEWKPQTVSTFLIRLVKKGYVSTYRKGRYFYYVPVVPLEEYQKRECEKMLQRLFLGDSSKMRSCLAQVEREALKA